MVKDRVISIKCDYDKGDDGFHWFDSHFHHHSWLCCRLYEVCQLVFVKLNSCTEMFWPSHKYCLKSRMDGLIDGRPLSGTESLLILQISVWNLKVIFQCTFGLSALEKKIPPKILISHSYNGSDYPWRVLMNQSRTELQRNESIYILYIHVYSGDVCFFLD